MGIFINFILQNANSRNVCISKPSEHQVYYIINQNPCIIKYDSKITLIPNMAEDRTQKPTSKNKVTKI